MAIYERCSFQSKLDKIKGDGLENLAIISDFDWTLTSRNSKSSYCVVKQSPEMPPEYPVKSKILFDKYYGALHDDKVPIDKKRMMMKNWAHQELELMQKYGLTKSKFEEIKKNNDLLLRNGNEKFFDLIKNSPLIIMSAGLKQIIDDYLKKSNTLNGNQIVFGNELDFNTNGELIGYKGEIINMINKDARQLLKTPFYEKKIKGKKNFMVIGDHLEDVYMSRGLEYETCLNILFRNDKKKSLDKFLEHADIIIDQQLDDMHDIVDILKIILSN